MKKIIGIFICMLLIISFLSITDTVLAGNEEDPEIVDEIDDIFGTFIRNPRIFNFFKALKIFNIDNFDFMDIKSAWFYESPDQQDTLCCAIELKNLEFINQRTIYAMHWKFNQNSYAVGVHVYKNGEIQYFGIVGLSEKFKILAFIDSRYRINNIEGFLRQSRIFLGL